MNLVKRFLQLCLLCWSLYLCSSLEGWVIDDDITTEPTISFLVLGDWGKGGAGGVFGSTVGIANDDFPSEFNSLAPLANNNNNKKKNNNQQFNQLAIAAAMASFATPNSSSSSSTNHSSFDVAFVVALGDNFYDNGVASATDSLWDELWINVYLATYPSLRIPWYPVFGNHDYGGGPSAVKAQLDRTTLSLSSSSQMSNSTTDKSIDYDLWKFPATNYTRKFLFGCNQTSISREDFNRLKALESRDGELSSVRQDQVPKFVMELNNSNMEIAQKHSIQVVFIDTTTLSPSTNKCCNQNGGISLEEQQLRIANQLDHIEKMLREAMVHPPTWLLVAGHYPIFSAGDHGDNYELQQYLLPLLKKYHVHAYLCGHDHISEHLFFDGIHFFVAGAGSMTDSLKTTSRANLLWSGVGYSAFAVVEANATVLSIAYRDGTNKERYSYALGNPLRIEISRDSSANVTDDISDTPVDSGVTDDLRVSTNLVLGFSLAVIASVMMSIYNRIYGRRWLNGKSDQLQKNKKTSHVAAGYAYGRKGLIPDSLTGGFSFPMGTNFNEKEISELKSSPQTALVTSDDEVAWEGVSSCGSQDVLYESLSSDAHDSDSLEEDASSLTPQLDLESGHLSHRGNDQSLWNSDNKKNL